MKKVIGQCKRSIGDSDGCVRYVDNPPVIKSFSQINYLVTLVCVSNCQETDVYLALIRPRCVI